jgi:hypothetical protein
LDKAASLARKLQEADYQVNPVFYPIVPREKERVRLVMHADNTAAQIDDIVDLIMSWSMERLAGPLGKPASLVYDRDMYQNTAFAD